MRVRHYSEAVGDEDPNFFRMVEGSLTVAPALSKTNWFKT
uniref:Uncharacterized protein n=1 Tax=Anguilla anguilla TaxID=7936 RepID=A0A0E9T4T2_ANGAN